MVSAEEEAALLDLYGRVKPLSEVLEKLFWIFGQALPDDVKYYLHQLRLKAAEA